MKKINILFDPTVIYDSNRHKGTRSGVYWASYNLLIRLKECPLYNIYLLQYGLRSLKRSNFLASFPYIALYTDTIYKKNISVYKCKIRQTKNIIQVGVLILKLIKNQFCFIRQYLLGLNKKKQNDAVQNIHVWFSPFYPIPELEKINFQIKKFQLLYDCIPFLKHLPYYKKPDGNSFIFRIVNHLNKETYYFCISELTKNDFLSIASDKLDDKKMLVTPIASSQFFELKHDKKAIKTVFVKYGLRLEDKCSFIFSLCNVDPRKNLIFTIQCFIKFIKKHSIDNLYFLLGGGQFKTYHINQLMSEILNFNDYQNKIKLLGYVDDADVNIFYSNSLFFPFLSQYEGFGMPPLEAMQAGTPVICSNNSSLPEVVGDAAITITYNDEDACIKAFEDLYFNENLRKEYIAKGLERAKLFSWEKTFKLMSDKIISVINADIPQNHSQ